MNNVYSAILLTTLAGLSTGVGSLIAFFSKKTNKRFLSFTLGLSAGVMIYVSLVELFAKSKVMLETVHGEKMGNVLTVCGFFFGILLIAVIDRFIPDEKNPHETKTVEEMQQHGEKESKLLRTGVLTALALGIHNFPEGMATFISSLQSPELAIPIVFAIAIHNIPEGIAVSVPVFYATGSKGKAFVYSFVSGLAEPIGAIIGYLLLMPFINDTLNGIIFSVVAGIMVFISIDELLPSAHEYGEHHLAVYGLVAGMLIMAVSLIAFI